jgi:hypothetical protein
LDSAAAKAEENRQIDPGSRCASGVNFDLRPPAFPTTDLTAVVRGYWWNDIAGELDGNMQIRLQNAEYFSRVTFLQPRNDP